MFSDLDVFDRVLVLKFIHFSIKSSFVCRKVTVSKVFAMRLSGSQTHKPRFSRKSVCAIDKVFSDLDVFDRVLVLKFIHFAIKC